MFYSTVFFVFRNSLFYNHMDSDCIKVSSYLLGHLKPLTAVVNQKKVTRYLSTRGTQRSIRRHGHCVQVSSVANVVGLQLTVRKIPYL